MKLKTKVVLLAPILVWRSYRASRLYKKINKYDDLERYSMQFRNDYILKRAKKYIKNLNLQLEVIGFDNLPKNTSLIAPNHTSSFDAALIIAAMEHPQPGPDYLNVMPVFLGKTELQSNKKFRGFMGVLNTFYIDRKKPREALKVIDEIVAHAKEFKKHIVIFPEGTRSKDGKIGEFKGGAFRVAKKSFLPIVPVTINNAMSLTDFSREGKLKIQIIFHPPIKPMKFITMDTKQIAKKVEAVVASSWKKPEGKRSLMETKVA